MEQTTSLAGALGEIQDLKIEVVALRMAIDGLKEAVVTIDPRMATAFAIAKGELANNLPQDTELSRKLRDRVLDLLRTW